MVQIQRYIQRTNLTSNSSYPYLNSIFVNNSNSLLSEVGEKPAFNSFIRYARRSPQLMSFLDIIISDIISDTIKFIPMEQNVSGRNNKLKAKKFFDDNNGVKILQSTLRDMLLLGIGYNWIGKVEDTKLKEICKLATKQVYESKEEMEYKAEQIYNEIMNDSVSLKKLRGIAASTMNIVHNETEVTGYTQVVGVNKKYYKPDEIITYELMPFNGEVYPFCPMEALLAEVYLLWLITQNYVSFFENGGHPDKVFILPKEIANSKNHTYLVETLQKYKKIQNKHGNLVFTGDIKVEDLMKVESQMEHQDLGLYLVGVLALFYKIPSGRIPFLIGKAANNGDAGGLADGGYWRQISVLQSVVENSLNKGIFNKYFKVDIQFGRGYKQDEVREIDIEVKKTQIAIQRVQSGFWTTEYAAFYLEVPEDVIQAAIKEKEERDAKMLEQQQQSELFKQKSGDKSVIDEPDKQLKNNVKSDTQKKNKSDPAK